MTVAPGPAPRAAAFDCWIFDLDNTLYAATSNLFAQVDRRIGRYVERLLGLPPGPARLIQKQLFRDHGTTLRGLMSEHDIAPLEFLDYVHDIDFSIIGPDAVLAAAIAALPGRKLVFTNACGRYAANILQRLGIAPLIEAIFDITDADYLPKPAPATYDRLVARYGIDPRRAIMIEDITRNLVPAAKLGMTTVWVPTDNIWAREEEDFAHIDYVADDLGGWLAGLAD